MYESVCTHVYVYKSEPKRFLQTTFIFTVCEALFCFLFFPPLLFSILIYFIKKTSKACGALLN